MNISWSQAEIKPLRVRSEGTRTGREDREDQERIKDMHCSIHRKNRRRAWSRCRKCGRGLWTSTCMASSICFDANRLSPARKKCPSSARPARRRSARRLPCPHPVEEQTNSSRRSQDSGDPVVNYVCRDRADHLWQFGMRSKPACRPRRRAMRGWMLIDTRKLGCRIADWPLPLSKPIGWQNGGKMAQKGAKMATFAGTCYVTIYDANPLLPCGCVNCRQKERRETNSHNHLLINNLCRKPDFPNSRKSRKT